MALNRSKLKATELAFVDTNNIEYIVHDFERQGLVVRTKDQLKSALSKLGSNNGTICIVDTIDIDEDLIIPENISLKFFNGGILNVLTQDIPDEDVGTGDGSTTEFSLAYSPVLENSETIYVDGTEQTRNTDYTINYETGVITFTSAPADGASITADYTRRFKLTINGGIDAGLFQIFSGDGVVTGNPKIEAVYPEWFGAKGDGVTDDIEAIQKAIDYFSNINKVIRLCSEEYLVTLPINAVAINNTNRRGVKLKGARFGSGDYKRCTRIIGATNKKAIVEIVHNDAFQLEDIILTSATTNGSTIGIYQAFSTSYPWTGNCRFRNITITFDNDDITQNNNFGTIGIINIGGEETTYECCEVWANTPVVFSWSSSFRKQSSDLTPTSYDSFEYEPVHVKLSDITSNTSNTVFRTINCRFIAKGYNSPIVLLHEVGSYYSYGDFLQKRSSSTGTDDTNGIGYEFWNIHQAIIRSAIENVKTPMMFHRGASALDVNIRFSGGPGQDKPLIYFLDDGGSYNVTNCDIILDTPQSITGRFIGCDRNDGEVHEPCRFTFVNSKFKINRLSDEVTVEPKVIYNSKNCWFEFGDINLFANEKVIEVPFFVKDIDTPGTTTDIAQIDLPQTITNLSGFSASVIADFHVSTAESEGAGSQSSLYIKALWEITREYDASKIVVSTSTLNNLTASTNANGNDITDLTLSYSADTTQVILQAATVQSGVNNAKAYLSGKLKIIYAGGYSRAPQIKLL